MAGFKQGTFTPRIPSLVQRDFHSSHGIPWDMEAMRTTRYPILAAILCLVPLATAIPGCRGVQEPAEPFYHLIIAPLVWHSGEMEAFSLILFHSGSQVRGNIEAALLQDNKPVVQTSRTINDKDTIEFRPPGFAEGDYQLRVSDESASFAFRVHASYPVKA
ncbi:hypothetical protein ACFLVD_00785 [Chloroflexota bacterium]